MNINTYEELGHPNAEDQYIKAQLVSHVADIIRRMELTQAEVAERTDLTQPQVSNILRGRFRDVSIEKLLRITNALKHNVRIVIDQDASEAADTTVEMAVAAN
jgi:predicted XRE-type DNA-binding protein